MNNNQANQADRKLITTPKQNAAVKMDNKQAKPKPSDVPKYVTNNLRSYGDAMMELPEAAKSADLLQPKSRRVRVTHADGSFSSNVAYLSLTPQSQAERRTLVANISNFLGYDMKAWHEALHSPSRLPDNALDWSTVLLQRTYDLTRITPGGATVTEWLTGVFQAMKTTCPKPKASDWVQAAIDTRQAMIASSSSPSSEIAASRSVEIKQLQDQVKDLQHQVEDRELEVGLWEYIHLDDDDDDDEKTDSGQTRHSIKKETAAETETKASANHASSSHFQHAVQLSGEEADIKQAWADHDAVREVQKTKRELEEKRHKMDDLLSSAGSEVGDSKTFHSLPSPPRSQR
ncbi:hypothetical protein Q7P36_005936 [Cladosporium allicinum]